MWPVCQCWHVIKQLRGKRHKVHFQVDACVPHSTQSISQSVSRSAGQWLTVEHVTAADSTVTHAELRVKKCGKKWKNTNKEIKTKKKKLGRYFDFQSLCGASLLFIAADRWIMWPSAPAAGGECTLSGFLAGAQLLAGGAAESWLPSVSYML